MATFKVAGPAVPREALSQAVNGSVDPLHARNGLNEAHINGVATKTFTDVPVDSTSILERLFSNLRRVGESETSNGHT